MNGLLNVTCGVTVAINNWLYPTLGSRNADGSLELSPLKTISSFLDTVNGFFGNMSYLLDVGGHWLVSLAPL